MTTDLRSRDPGPELPGLAATLDRAADQHFDVGAVRAGVHGLVVRRRRRRRLLTSAVAAAAAVVVAGGTTWLVGPGRDLGQVAQPSPPALTAAPTSPSTAPTPSSTTAPATTTPATTTPTTTAPPTTDPSTTDPSTTDPSTTAASTTAASTDPAYEVVPDAVEPSAAEAGAGLQEQLDLAQDDAVHTPPVAGLMCNQGLPGLSSVGGRQWMFHDPQDSGARSVEVAVTVFAPGSGADALAEVADDTGRCRWVDQVRDQGGQPWAAASPDRLLVEGEPVFGAATYRAVVRVQDVLVGVQVVDERGANQAQADAQALAGLVAQKVARSAMPAAGR